MKDFVDIGKCRIRYDDICCVMKDSNPTGLPTHIFIKGAMYSMKVDFSQEEVCKLIEDSRKRDGKN